MRTDAALTQPELAARLNRPQSFVAKYANGKRRLDVVEFIEVAEASGSNPGRVREGVEPADAQRRPDVR